MDGVDGCTDCDDTDANNFPGNAEVCDSQDNNCSGGADEGLSFSNYYPDNDGDNYGSGAAVSTCDGAPAGHVANNIDCNDANAAVNPGTPEVSCDGFDNDCNAATADDVDNDMDGVGSCTDCNDGDATIFPGRHRSLQRHRRQLLGRHRRRHRVHQLLRGRRHGRPGRGRLGGDQHLRRCARGHGRQQPRLRRQRQHHLPRRPRNLRPDRQQLQRAWSTTAPPRSTSGPMPTATGCRRRERGCPTTPATRRPAGSTTTTTATTPTTRSLPVRPRFVTTSTTTATA